MISKIQRCLFISLLTLFTVNGFGQKNRPNIIFILTDDLGYHDVSYTGGADVQTPNIDKLASEGMRFTNFYANSTVCSPSRAALLTGRFPDLVGVPGVIRQKQDNSYGYLSPAAITLGEKLQFSGYHTALIGKWHLGQTSPNLPNERGFNYFKGFLAGMVDDYYGHLRMGVNWMRENEKHINPEGHCTDLLTGWAVDYIKKREHMQNPFFLYLAYNAPHSPIQPPQEYYEAVLKREKGITEKRAKFVGLVEHLDDGIGKVIAQLIASGFEDNTMIIFSSDNGGSLRYGSDNGDLRGGKGDLYEGGIKVPMFVKWPGHIEQDTENNNICLLMDFYPTICEIAQMPVNHKIDGMSILPLFYGNTLVTNDRYLHWMRREGNIYGGQIYYATRYKNLKILQNTPYQPIEFFDLDSDSREKAPLEQNNDIYQQLFKAQHDHILESGRIVWQKSEKY